MDEPAALSMLAESVEAAGDDAAVVDGHVLTTDMLHETTDFPEGVTRYTAGWRAVAASLSDVAAMGAEAVAAVAAYGAPTFDAGELTDFVTGASEVCDRVNAAYVGGDLDTHAEFTVATTALGRVAHPIHRDGARVGDGVYVTGTFGRSAAAVELFERGKAERANGLFRFVPRVEAGLVVAPAATAMIDSSDGLARSLHQLAAASECGFAIDGDAIPVDPAVEELAGDAAAAGEMARHFGEDFELVFTGPDDAVDRVRDGTDVSLTRIGETTAEGVLVDGDALPDRGYTHGDP